MRIFLSLLLRRLSPLWILFAANALVPSGIWGYDAQTQPTIAYHAASLSALDYDSAPASIADETENRTAGTDAIFTLSAELVAAKGTSWTQVSSDARAILRDVESRAGMSVPGNQRSLLANQVATEFP